MRVSVETNSVLEDCLDKLLSALNWHGYRHQLLEALPYCDPMLTVEDFCKVMSNLGYSNSSFFTKLSQVDTRLFPCLYVDFNDQVWVLLEATKQGIKAFKGGDAQEAFINLSDEAFANSQGKVYSFKTETDAEVKAKSKKNWLYETYVSNKPLFYNAIAISFLLNLLALGTPLFIMAVYNKVIATESLSMMVQFAFGVVIALLGVYFLFKLRAQALAVIGAKFDREIGDKIFERLLYLAPVYTETATVGAQISRIKDFDRVREFLSGPMFAVLFDFPFLLISLVIVFILGGNLIFIPLTVIILLVLITLILSHTVRVKTSALTEEGSNRQAFLLESIKNIHAIKYNCAEHVWAERFREISGKSAYCSLWTSLLTAISSALSDAIMISAGLAVISFGALKVVNGTLSIGAMIALMMITWRMLAPLKTLFNVYPRLQQLYTSFQQISRLMNIVPESHLYRKGRFMDRKLKGQIRFNRISFRYQGAYDPSVIGVSFKIQPGSLVAIIGRNGSGKSTVLKLLMDMYQPQAGSITIDGVDVRQRDPLNLRSSIGYLPQNPELFYGTIAANLRMANPCATDEMLYQAAKDAGVYEEIMALPEQFEAHIRDFSGMQLAFSFQQQLCLARAYLRGSSILLLDEPANALDFSADQKLIQYLQKIRGKTTVVVVTHRPSHLKIADQILLFEQGQLMIAGPPDDILAKIPKEYL